MGGGLTDEKEGTGGEGEEEKLPGRKTNIRVGGGVNQKYREL